MNARRVESDTFGPIEVPADRLWGAQTQRSFANFRISGERQPMAGRSRRLADSAATAAAVSAAALAFRQVLQPIVRFVPGRGIGHLLAGCLLVAVAVAIGVFAVESGLGTHRASQIRVR